MSRTPEQKASFRALDPDMEQRLRSKRDRARREPGPGDSAAQSWGPYTLTEMVGEGPAARAWRARPGDVGTELGDVGAELGDTGTESGDLVVKLLRNAVVKGYEEPGARVAAARTWWESYPRTPHENLIAIQAVEEHAGKTGIIMPWIDGPTLDMMVRDRAKLPFATVLSWGAQVARGLSHLHAAGVIHDDIEPRNVVVRDDTAVLMDPSVTRALGDGGDRAVALSGTPLFMSPERITGAAPSVSSDIYSLGVTLYYVLTGSYPVRGPLVRRLREDHAAGQRTSLAEAAPHMPRLVVDVIDRACALDPNQRTATAEDLAHALDQAKAVDVNADRAARAPAWQRWWLELPTPVRRAIWGGLVLAFIVALLLRD